MQWIKGVYVKILKALGRLLSGLGLLQWHAPPPTGRLGHYLKSLFAIHDIDKMIALDVPWWTYGSIDAVNDFLKSKPDCRVFEYGSGASTHWLAKRAGSVISIDHDQDWYDVIKRKTRSFLTVDNHNISVDESLDADPLYLAEKAGYKGRSFKAYAAAIDRYQGTFDLIIIDGRARSACLAHAIPKLAAGGMIVFDNAGRKRYKKAIDIACETAGLQKTVFAGLTPALPYGDVTVLLSAPT